MNWNWKDILSLVVVLGLIIAVAFESGVFTAITIFITYLLIGQNFNSIEKINENNKTTN